MHAARQPANIRRPAAHGGGHPEKSQHRGRNDHPLRPAKGSFHATESSRMSDACGVGLLPISSRRASMRALLASNASTTAGSHWPLAPATNMPAAQPKENPPRHGLLPAIAPKHAA